MYLSLANTLATWARESAPDDTTKAVYSSIMALTGVAMTAVSARVTLGSLSLAREDVQRLASKVEIPLPKRHVA